MPLAQARSEASASVCRVCHSPGVMEEPRSVLGGAVCRAGSARLKYHPSSLPRSRHMDTFTAKSAPRTVSRGRRLKELINAPEILLAPGVFDGYSARLVERAGFKSASITGAGTSESRLGWADRGIMGLEENLANARRIADCTDLLLRADADTG